MRRSLGIGAIAATVLAGLSTAGPSAAAEPPFHPTTQEHVSHGTGQATAEARSGQLGRVHADASAVGGTDYLLPELELIPIRRPTTGLARAYVSTDRSVSAGVYDVKVTIRRAWTDERVRGNGTAEGSAVASAQFVRAGGEHLETVGFDLEPLPHDPRTVVLTFEAHVPHAGGLQVFAEVQAVTNAEGAGNVAHTESAGRVTAIEIARAH